jgi:protocatechuate 3,4-dioxygenase beta subunit
MKTATRREMLEKTILRGGLLAGAASMSESRLLAFWQAGEKAAPKPTPSEVLGPFFKKGAPNEAVLHKSGMPGFPLKVMGKVYNTRGEKVEGARIDMWQADHAGRYDVVGFKYRTKLVVPASGEYAIETIMPGHYDDRPAQHIHYMITAPGHKTLVTQNYFETDPFFEGDVNKNYKKRGVAENRDLVLPVTLYENGTPHASITFDLVLERA